MKVIEKFGTKRIEFPFESENGFVVVTIDCIQIVPFAEISTLSKDCPQRIKDSKITDIFELIFPYKSWSNYQSGDNHVKTAIANPKTDFSICFCIKAGSKAMFNSTPSRDFYLIDDDFYRRVNHKDTGKNAQSGLKKMKDGRLIHYVKRWGLKEPKFKEFLTKTLREVANFPSTILGVK